MLWDAEGRPRFVLYANSFGASGASGTLLAACDEACTRPQSWRFGLLSRGELKNPALVIDPEGLPHVAYIAQRPSPDYQPVLHYLRCDEPDCSGTGADLELLITTEAGAESDAAYALRLNDQGHPRLLLYPGLGIGGTLPSGQTHYLSCDENCAASRDGWTVLNLGFSGQLGSGGLDFVLDGQGGVQAVLRAPAPVDEASYAACTGHCELDGSAWKSVTLATTQAAKKELGTLPRQGCPDCSPPIAPCPEGFWDAGWWPSIAVDGQGKARFVFEVQLQSGGGQCRAGRVARMSRMVVFE